MDSINTSNQKFQKGSICDIEGAKLIAKKLLEQYGDGQNKVDNTSKMMIDAYKSMNKGFNPSNADQNTYFKVLDKDQDGKITLKDLEIMAIKYLVDEESAIQYANQRD